MGSVFYRQLGSQNHVAFQIGKSGITDILQLPTGTHSALTITHCLTTGAFGDTLDPFMKTLRTPEVLHVVNSITHLMTQSGLVDFVSTKLFPVLPVFLYIFSGWVKRLPSLRGREVTGMSSQDVRQSQGLFQFSLETLTKAAQVEHKTGQYCVPRVVLRWRKVDVQASKNFIAHSSAQKKLIPKVCYTIC